MTELEQHEYYLKYLKVEKLNKDLKLYSEIEPFEVIANYQIERMLDNLKAVKKESKTITLLAGNNKIMAFEMGLFKHNDFPKVYLTNESFNAIAEGNPNYHEGYGMQMALQFLLFKHCAELEIKVLDSRPNQTPSRAKVGKEKFLSEFPLPVTVISSTWFTKVIRKEGFKVSAHLRWQPFGPGRSEKKLIMIKEFQKHGYTRRAQIEN